MIPPFTPRRIAICIFVFLLGLAFNAFQLGTPPLATNLIDPVTKIKAQDEAVYAATSIRMAAGGDWLTPRFMGRLALYKPPLFYWCSALAVKVAGVSEAALRAPSAIAVALAAAILFAWLWQTRGVWAGISVVLLFLSSRMIHTLARTATTDALTLLWMVAAIAVLARDPLLRSRYSAAIFGAIAGLAVMTKAVTGVLPFIALVICWLALLRQHKPALSRFLLAAATAAAVVLPWHLYQWITHSLWFWNEYILTEHLALGLSSPQTTSEGSLLFYSTRLWWTDAGLCIATILALPALFQAVRSREPRALLLAAWIAATTIALFVFQYHAAWYLAPLIAALAVAAAQHAPAFNKPVVAVLLALIVAIKITMPIHPFGLSYNPESEIPIARTLESYCRSGNPAPLFIRDAEDQFYAADLAISEVHYVLDDPHASPIHGALDYGYLGIIVTEDEFRRLDSLRPVYRRRLRDWGVDSDEPIASVILTRDRKSAASLVARGGPPDPNRQRVPGWCGSPR